MNAKLIPIAMLLAVAGPAPAAQTLETAFRTNGSAVQEPFDPVKAVIQTSSAVIQRGTKDIAYGTVMTPDGHIFTKASEIGDGSGLTVVVADKIYREVTLVATDPTWDVALLKIPAENLTPAALALDQPDPARGTWVVANGATSRSQRRIQIGIISATAREIPHAGGPVLGVSYEEKGGKLEITDVAAESGATAAGIVPGDILLRVGGEKITGPEALAEVIAKHRVGEFLPVTIGRDGEEVELSVELKGRVDVFGEEITRNDVMSGRYSERRSGFPRVIQHDIIADRHRIGGPVLDLDGRCLGMNIARANRCETFAIPATDLNALAVRMIAGAD